MTDPERALADALRSLADDPAPRALALASMGFTDAHVSALCDAIAASAAPVEALDLRDNRVGDDGARALASLLALRPAMRTLDVTANELGGAGVEALVAAACAHPSLTTLALDGAVPSHLRASLVARVALNRNQHRDSERRAVTAARRSPVEAPVEVRAPDAQAMAQALATLRGVEAMLRAGAPLPEGARALRQVCERITREASHAARGERGRQRALRAARDQASFEATGIRRLRREPAEAVGDAPVEALERGRNCYVCKKHYRALDGFYDQLCPPCAAFNRARRERTADLSGRVALVTGGRVKIGQRAALKLLRAGARVVVTTRFPHDAWRRYAREPDFEAWRDRLEVHGLDLRFLSHAEAFARSLAARLDRLDVIVSNAAQTVARPAEWYAEMARLEDAAARALPPGVAPCAPAPWSPSDGLGEGIARFEAGAAALDRHGQPLDARAHNAWRAVVGEVSTHELVSVHAVTALAPFVLVNALRARMASGPAGDRFVVLVSAVEGQFVRRNKTPRHPHTNMAKAALNMLARTAASDLASDRIWCCAVDTGWITDENPQPIAARMAARGFAPPLDEEDGAARVLDPVFRVMHGEAPAHGVFLKDYEVAPW